MDDLLGTFVRRHGHHGRSPMQGRWLVAAVAILYVMATLPRALGRAAAVLTVLAATAACDGTVDGGPVKTEGPPPGTATPAVTQSLVPARSFNATGLRLCEHREMLPLAALSLTVRREDPTPPLTAPGAACLFEMETADGHEANFRVEASTPASAEEAVQLYGTARQGASMRREGGLEGIGDEAEAYTRQSQPGFKYAEHMAQARENNLVVQVWLAVGGDEFVPTKLLAQETVKALRRTLALVPTA
ncbi:hypothetical protein [Micromonospora sp. NPDC047187]|uniref:hypothetical protein n=1 Tax=Micromonospora sp. NPDC047187 TaxID=3155262 RepID=UPI003405E3A0